MVTTRQAWLGVLILLLVMLLIIVTAAYWQHVTGVNFLVSLAATFGPITMNC